MVDVLAHNPCSRCVGNDERCSLIDSSEEYNAINCELISDWILRIPPGRPAGMKTQNLKLPEQCQSCHSANISKRGIRTWKNGHTVQSLRCKSCMKSWSVQLN